MSHSQAISEETQLYWPQCQSQADTTSDWPAHDFMLLTVTLWVWQFSQPHCPLQTLFHQFVNKDITGDGVESLDKQQPLLSSHSLRHLTTKGHQVGQADFPFKNPCSLFLITFLSFIYLKMVSRRVCLNSFPGSSGGWPAHSSLGSPPCTSWRLE